MKTLYTGNIVYGNLPNGCKLCLRGFKSVIFITGICPSDCFYCPISLKKRGKDIFLVNEREVKLDNRLNELIAEVLTSGSRGAGITGGDPLAKPERTEKVLAELKDVFGSSFHVHIYTSGKTLSTQLLLKLEKLELDELRLHTDLRNLNRVLGILRATRPSFDMGFEIPVMPGEVDATLKFIDIISDYDFISFINLNELEFSESNSLKLRERGYELSHNGKTAVMSYETALEVLNMVEACGLPLNVHFCPASSKDNYQTRLRFYRRGIMCAKPHELPSDEGTLLKALVPETCRNLPHQMVFKGRLGLESPLVLAEVLGIEYTILEELPDYPRTPLNVL